MSLPRLLCLCVYYKLLDWSVVEFCLFIVKIGLFSYSDTHIANYPLSVLSHCVIKVKNWTFLLIFFLLFT